MISTLVTKRRVNRFRIEQLSDAKTHVTATPCSKNREKIVGFTGLAIGFTTKEFNENCDLPLKLLRFSQYGTSTALCTKAWTFILFFFCLRKMNDDIRSSHLFLLFEIIAYCSLLWI